MPRNMVKSAEYRFRKYGAKFDPTVVSARFTALKDIAVEQTQSQQATLKALEDEIKKILSSHALPTWHNIPYLNAGRAMYRKSRSFTGPTFENEVLAIIEGWASKGLDRDILVEIAGLFGVAVPSYGT
jgi:hypothetical protein